jgi:hypothetical protein
MFSPFRGCRWQTRLSANDDNSCATSPRFVHRAQPSIALPLPSRQALANDDLCVVSCENPFEKSPTKLIGVWGGFGRAASPSSIRYDEPSSHSRVTPVHHPTHRSRITARPSSETRDAFQVSVTPECQKHTHTHTPTHTLRTHPHRHKQSVQLCSRPIDDDAT